MQCFFFLRQQQFLDYDNNCLYVNKSNDDHLNDNNNGGQVFDSNSNDGQIFNDRVLDDHNSEANQQDFDDSNSNRIINNGKGHDNRNKNNVGEASNFVFFSFFAF